jgi:hypothetical protein
MEGKGTMNRWLMAAVIGLTVAGCAEGIEDPAPAPRPDPVQKPPPAQAFNGELEEEMGEVAKLKTAGIDELPPLPQDKPGLPTPPVPGE